MHQKDWYKKMYKSIHKTDRPRGKYMLKFEMYRTILLWFGVCEW